MAETTCSVRVPGNLLNLGSSQEDPAPYFGMAGAFPFLGRQDLFGQGREVIGPVSIGIR